MFVHMRLDHSVQCSFYEHTFHNYFILMDKKTQWANYRTTTALCKVPKDHEISYSKTGTSMHSAVTAQAKDAHINYAVHA